MTNREKDYRTMAQNVLKLLTDHQPAWAAAYPKLVPDYQALATALRTVDEKAQQQGVSGTEGYTDAKDLAEEAALDAAVPVLRGLKALQLDHPRPELAAVVAHTRSTLDKLRDQDLVATLEGLRSKAEPLARELADELVTAAHLQALATTTAAFKALVGTPREQAVATSSLGRQAKEQLGHARTALDRLDVRIGGLEATMPELVTQYRQLRRVVETGGRGAL